MSAAGVAESMITQEDKQMILYLHGFLSSPQTLKARLIEARLHALGIADVWHCPALPVSPKAAIELIERTLALAKAADDHQEVTVIGSSLGGYYATWLAERHGFRTVLLNPVTKAQYFMQQYLGLQPQSHGGSVLVEPRYLDELGALEVAQVTRLDRYYLIAATGDEELDYRDMLAKYAGATTVLIEGGDHAISDFPVYLDGVLAFCGIGPK